MSAHDGIDARRARTRTAGRSPISETDHLRALIAPDFARRAYLNSATCLLHDEILATGAIDATSFYVREIIARAVQIGAAGLVLAHNHPSGDPVPSRSDIERTRALVNVRRGLGIEVHDNLIIAGRKVASLRAMGAIGS
ncbi:MAG TPA: JAB domain-containing protein [Sphingomonas sp.]|jgi:DNA repair protein RadC|uniref:JAB domain-containing protein n=1 Tax=Sphingomonas sp. TaxID=28214 RepID=UPI002EDAE15F